MAVSVTQLRELLRYEPETGKLFWRERSRKLFKTDRSWNSWNTRFAGREAFTADSDGYRQGAIFGKRYLAHRVIWALVAGVWPGFEIDHEDHDRANNRWENLKPATRVQNCRNQSRAKNNTSGATGVTFDRRRGHYVAQLHKNGAHTYLGSFDTLDEAAAARRAAEIAHGFHPNHGKV